MDKFWRRQEAGRPLFPDLLWSKPERRDAAGKLAIVGGNSRGFAGVAAAYQTALATGVGQVRVVLPDALKAVIATPDLIRGKQSSNRGESGLPRQTSLPRNDNYIFAPTNPSGGLAAGALTELNAAATWADLVLFIGDNGQNSETAGLLETFLARHSERSEESRGSFADTQDDKSTPIVLTRDAVDLIKNAAETVLNRSNTHLVVSLSQLQKLLKNVYYPRVITFSQGAKQIAETLHKFTATYPVSLTLWHSGNLFVAKDGQVISQEFDQPMRVWSGEVAVRQAVWQIWSADPIAAVATSWIELQAR